MGSIFLVKMGLRDQNNGKKIGISGSRIYHVTTLIVIMVMMLLYVDDDYDDDELNYDSSVC